MALLFGTRYPGQTDTADPDYPNGKARNATAFNDGTGTPLEKDWLNDDWGFKQALLAAAGITASGNPDKVGASQYLDAIVALTSKIETITLTPGEGTITPNAKTTVLRVNCVGRFSIFGIAGGVNGRRLRLYNTTENNDSALELNREAGLATAANRILYNYENLVVSGTGGLILYEDMGIDLWYDGVRERWRPVVHMIGGFVS